jgi:hypothetical protein
MQLKLEKKILIGSNTVQDAYGVMQVQFQKYQKRLETYLKAKEQKK